MQQMRMPPPMTRTAADKRAHVMREIVEIVLFVGLVFVIAHFVVASYGMNGNEAMRPQLRDDDEIIVNRAAYILAGPRAAMSCSSPARPTPKSCCSAA